MIQNKVRYLFIVMLLVLISTEAIAQIDTNFPIGQRPDSAEFAKAGNRPIIKTSLNGVITASGFYQNGSFGMGDGSITMWANAAQPADKKNQFGGDLRKTWIILKATAYNLPDNWTASGRVEIDFLGGYAGQGGFADENLLPRLRVGYVELHKNQTRIRLGQAWTPMVATFPASVTHFAMGYGSAGGIGFRNPGLFVYQNLNSKQSSTKIRLDAAIFRGSWVGAASEPYGRDAGEIGVPQTEIGVFVENRSKAFKWEVSLVGHYDRKQIYNPLTKDYTGLTGKAIQLGTILAYDNITLQGSAYTGRAIGQIWGNLLQFGDIRGNGAWAQAGYAFNKRLSVWFMYGYDNPNDGDVKKAVTGDSRLHNQIFVPMLKYNLGPVNISLEYFRAQTKWNTVNNEASQIKRTSADQIALGTSFMF